MTGDEGWVRFVAGWIVGSVCTALTAPWWLVWLPFTGGR